MLPKIRRKCSELDATRKLDFDPLRFPQGKGGGVIKELRETTNAKISIGGFGDPKLFVISNELPI